MGSSKTKKTVDHDEIREWVEAHHGHPAAVRADNSGLAAEPGELRIDLPDAAADEDLIPLSWDDWYDKFEGERLAFVYQERKASGDDSPSYKLVTE
jgi:hypothetical protein